MDPGPTRRPRPARPATRLAVAGAALALGSGCTAAPEPPPAVGVPDPGEKVAVAVRDPGPDDDTPRVELRSRVARVAGRLSDVRRERVARRVRTTVAHYLDAAFAGADRRPFTRFRPGLRQSARADQRVLTGPAVPAPVTRAAVTLSVAAPGGRPVGVTARIRLDSPAGSRPGTALTGRLVLTRVDGQWQVFGYDLARSGGGR